ncbi:MAG TPA: monovalent cation/H(+) antiporter subunit G [Actinomycetota bacterium]|nr:monovalent cation/H(+) antiporter subunit G [Actinomycetota bacterium]
MSVRDIVIASLLFGAVAVEIACALALLVVKDSFDRLHFLGPGATLGPLLVVTALVVENALSTNGVKAFLTGGLLLLTGPILTHATARAARVRQFGHWEPLPFEEVDQD